MTLENQPTAKPTRKVTAGATSGVVVTIAVAGMELGEYEVTGWEGALLAIVAYFLGAYLAREKHMGG